MGWKAKQAADTQGVSAACLILLCSLLARWLRELVFVGAFAFDFVEDDFAQTQMVGGHFHVFIFFDVFEGFFEREHHRGNDAGFVVGSGGSHVGELLRFGGVMVVAILNAIRCLKAPK